MAQVFQLYIVWAYDLLIQLMTLIVPVRVRTPSTSVVIGLPESPLAKKRENSFSKSICLSFPTFQFYFELKLM